MVAFDIVMPFVLFALTMVAVFLNKRVEAKLRTSLDEGEFQPKHVVLFVVMIAVAVSVIVFVPQTAIIMFFVFSYSTLLFFFSYSFSNMQRRKAQIFFLFFGLAGIVGGTFSLLALQQNSLVYFGESGMFALAMSSFIVFLYEQKRKTTGERWYLAALPPILFALLFFVYSPTSFWSPVLMNIYGVVFAVLITLYLSSMFTWKTTFYFAVLLTIMDIILVLFTGVMVTAAVHVAALGLPVLISLPILPLEISAHGIGYISLGLGDFFFAGTLATQTYKKYGKKMAIVSAIAMTISFGAFEAFLLSSDFGAFPGTLMIVSGWAPVIAWRLIAERKTKNNKCVKNELKKVNLS